MQILKLETRNLKLETELAHESELEKIDRLGLRAGTAWPECHLRRGNVAARDRSGSGAGVVRGPAGTSQWPELTAGERITVCP